MLKIAVCDDEKIYRDLLADILNKYKNINAIDFEILFFENAEAYRENCRQNEEPDILLLDIEMGRQADGILLKEYLREQGSRTKILFTTSHMEAVQEAFGENVCGFLTKPVSEEKLFYYLDRMCDFENQRKIVLVGKEKEIHTVKLQDILFIKSDGSYSCVVTKEKEAFCDKGLLEWEKELEGASFFRIHKSCLVNLKHVLRVGEKADLDNGEQLVIARRRKKELKEAYKQYLIDQV